MIELYSSAVTVASGNQIPLNSIASSKGTSVVKSSTGTFGINKPGWYRVDVMASGVAGTAGNISIQLYKNGTAIPFAIVTESADDTTSTHNVSLSAVVKVGCPCCAYGEQSTLTLYNVGQTTTYSLVNAICTKIG